MATDPTKSEIAGQSTASAGFVSRRLKAAQFAWVLVALLAVISFLPGLVPWYQLLIVPVQNVDVDGIQLSLSDAAALAHLGWPLEVYAAFLIGIRLVSGGSFWLVSLFIFLRRRNDGSALLVAFVLLVAGANRLFELLLAMVLTADPNNIPPLLLVGFAVNSLALPMLIIFLFYFPNGKLIPSQARILVFAGAASIFLWDSINVSWGGPLDGWVTYVLLAAGIVAQVYRYWRVNSREQQQQVKWVFWAAVISLPIIILPGSFFDTFAPDGSFTRLTLLPLLILLEALIPLGLGISIRRHRLYDIDVIVRRTLVYALLTALLALVYFGGVALLQTLLRPLIGENNDLVVVATTLLIAALFLPLRSRVQAFIDRRFYRRKYDVAKTLAAFSASLRDEVELEQLKASLVEVVDETMQPAYVSLWLARSATAPRQRAPEEPTTPIVAK